jgi:predicted NAD/FAD-dependent oxidoreductase
MSAAAGGAAQRLQRPAAAPSSSSPSSPPAAADAASAADRARRRTKYRNDWQRRGDNELASQVVLSQPFPNDGTARVAIIGGGVAGLVCALELARLGVRSTVFDTGERGPGGRLATRTTADGSFVGAGGGKSSNGGSGGSTTATPLLAFDHAAQFFTADDPEFAALAEEWKRRGLVREWPAERVVRLGQGGGAGGGDAKKLPRPPFYVPATSTGFRGLAQKLADEAVATGMVELQCGAWVSRLEVDRRGGRSQWRAVVRAAASGGGGKKGTSNSSTRGCDEQGGCDQGGNGESKSASAPLPLFDAVVIAHNGKCANRLAAPMGSPRVARQLMSLRLSAAWVAMLAFERPLSVTFEGAFVSGGGGGKTDPQQQPLAWAANNTAKLGLLPTSDDAQASHPECWTLVSTDAYAQRRKVPQERVPADVARAVAAELSAAFAAAAGLGDAENLPPLAAPPRVQLWGAALPLNSPQVACVLDPAARVGVCGDWLLGAGVQGAALSGLELARRMAALRGVPMDQCSAAVGDASAAAAAADQDGLAMGLWAPFKPLGERTGPRGEFPSGGAEARAVVAATAAVRR